MTPTRGERNNNPTNIRRTGIKWLGERPEETDPAFCQFITPLYGIRAAFVNVRTHIRRLGKHATVTGLLHIWAPPTENDTAAYIAGVCMEERLDPAQVIAFDSEDVQRLVTGIILMENGRCIYSPEIIGQAWECAQSKTAPIPPGCLL